ncbi:MAG TPA: penicillin-binding transpeptidase domain-containing protein [Solirubrobacterales bacterium]|nr:penicillin-binding transpeptidase domain-containing protein [Solirubrobacterales bacterium]
MEGGVDYEADRARMILRRRITVAALIVIGLAAIAAVLFLRSSPEDEARSALEDFLAAYQERDYAGAAALTDGNSETVAAALEANVDGLDGAELTEAEVTSVEEDGGEASATVAYAWEVPGIGAFEYENPAIRVVEAGEEWVVRWRDDVVHPDLDSRGTRLGTTREWPERAPIMDREGSPLVLPRPVFEVGVIPDELADADAAVTAIADLTEADAKALQRSIEAAESPENFVPAITLRTEDYEPIRDELDAIPGVQIGTRELPLAPSKEFARALLGTVGPITEEQLEEFGDPYAVGDNVGQSGLQAQFEEQLAGTPTLSVVTRDDDGTPIDTLLEIEGERGKPLRTTLAGGIQTAAEETLGNSNDVTALVALEPSSGDVLAAATRPVEDAFNRVFEGQYPPGSTFKVVTTAALLRAGLAPDEIVECPATIVAGGREFRNFEGSAAGAVPFTTDFAESCNTAFISLADRLEPRDFPNAAADFGLGAVEEEPGVPTFLGDVPAPRDEVNQAASMIGQSEILASPVGMAGVAATVVAGRWHQPRVLKDDPEVEGPALPADEVETLRALMREVVTSGTGTALAAVPGEPIGKYGTAEYGSGDPPPTHAWFIAGREDVAVAVLAEDKPSGGEFAAPIAAEFLTRLG